MNKEMEAARDKAFDRFMDECRNHGLCGCDVCRGYHSDQCFDAGFYAGAEFAGYNAHASRLAEAEAVIDQTLKYFRDTDCFEKIEKTGSLTSGCHVCVTISKAYDYRRKYPADDKEK